MKKLSAATSLIAFSLMATPTFANEPLTPLQEGIQRLGDSNRRMALDSFNNALGIIWVNEKCGTLEDFKRHSEQSFVVILPSHICENVIDTSRELKPQIK